MLLILIGLVAAAGAAPRFPFSDETSLESLFNDDMLNMNNFWAEFNREMATLHQRIAEATQSLSSSVSKEGIDGNEYKFEIALSGFRESDISVKAGNGMVKVQAIKYSGPTPTNTYIIIRSLPDYVAENGNWTYENGVLKIVFPIINSQNEGADVQTTAPDHSREEVEADNTDSKADADIGVGSSSNSDSELMTNEIPTVKPIEGTTYSEGLKNDYEFVPLSRY